MTASGVRAPFAYFGGKQGMAQRIIDLMPPHRVYIEPFFGSGAVFFAKQPATHEIVNDLDGSVVTFFRMMRDHRDDLIEACALSPHARDEWNAAALDEDLDDLERARRFWVRVNQSFGKTAGTNTGWSVTVARSQSIPRSVAGRLSRFDACADRLMGATIESCDAADLVDRLSDAADTVIYADPPYLGSTRSGRSDNASDYRHDMANPEAHERLAGALRSTAATVIVSGYPSDLYESLYGDWWSTDVAVTAFSSNAKTVNRSGRIERLWMNRTPSLGTLWEETP